MSRESLRTPVAAVIVAAVAFLPFARGVLAGATLYFRDLSMYFLPVRRFALEGLAKGELRLWNPYVQDGVTLSPLAIGYPLDLLQLLRPDAYGISLVLALHVPLAAALFLLLARRLGFSRVAAAGGALAYALGGFLLSTLNLYVYAHAAAWAPLIVLGLIGVGSRGEYRDVALAALALALGLSTTGIEIVIQAVLIGCVLGWPRLADAPRRLLPAASTLALAGALAAPILLLVAGQVAASTRGHGFPAKIVLAQSVHPFTLLQVVVADLYGELADVANRWWGQNFFPRGFPYVLSLYLGATTLALAAVGALSRQRFSRRLVVLAFAGVLVSLGRWAGLAALVEAVPLLRTVRYPVKAFFTAHLALALLVTLGLSTLERDDSRRTWRQLAAVAASLGAVLLLPLGLPFFAPASTEAFSLRFFPSDFAGWVRAAVLGHVFGDAASGGIVALITASVALSVRRGWLGPTRGAALAVTVMCADLLRTGAGLNPMVSPSVLQPSPELAAVLPKLREGRVFVCDMNDSGAYQAARIAKRGGHEWLTFATAIETVTPSTNVPLRIASAPSPEPVILPEDGVLSQRETSCRHLDETLARIRTSGVRFLLSLDPLQHPDLLPEGTYAPQRIAPLVVHVYRVASQRPLVEVPSRDGVPGQVLFFQRRNDDVALEVESAVPGTLVLREAYDPAWRVRVSGRAVTVERAEGRYLAVPLPAGRRHVEFTYRPRYLRLALAVSALAAALALWLARSHRAGPTPASSA